MNQLIFYCIWFKYWEFIQFITISNFLKRSINKVDKMISLLFDKRYNTTDNLNRFLWNIYVIRIKDFFWLKRKIVILKTGDNFNSLNLIIVLVMFEIKNEIHQNVFYIFNSNNTQFLNYSPKKTIYHIKIIMNWWKMNKIKN